MSFTDLDSPCSEDWRQHEKDAAVHRMGSWVKENFRNGMRNSSGPLIVVETVTVRRLSGTMS